MDKSMKDETATVELNLDQWAAVTAILIHASATELHPDAPAILDRVDAQIKLHLALEDGEMS